MPTVSVDQEVAYYSEPRRSNDPQPGGPYRARVTAVREGSVVDLVVTFDTAERTKTNVSFAESPTKHHWSWLPPKE